MARPTIVKSSRKDRGNCRCGSPLAIGVGYRAVSFFRGPTKVRCLAPACAFRPSELTQSKMSNALAAGEQVEDLIEGWDGTDLPSLQRDIESETENIREVAQEYRESADAIREVADNSIADDMEEKAEGLEEWADEIDAAATDASEFDEPEPDDASSEAHQAWEEEREDHQQGIEDTINDALSNFPG